MSACSIRFPRSLAALPPAPSRRHEALAPFFTQSTEIARKPRQRSRACAPVPAAAGLATPADGADRRPDRCGRIPCLVPAAPGRHRRDVASLPDGRVAGLWRVPAAGVDLDPLALGNVLEGLSQDVGGGSPSPRMQGMQEQGWWRVCVSHTIWPLLGLLLFFAVLGWLAQECVPGASHLLQVIQGGSAVGSFISPGPAPFSAALNSGL